MLLFLQNFIYKELAKNNGKKNGLSWLFLRFLFVFDYKTAYEKKAFTKGKKGSNEYVLSPELGKVLKAEKLSRGDIMKKIWKYIKDNDLQDPKNKRLIKPNADLAKVFGSKEPIDMMQLSKHLGKHMKRS